MKLFSKEEDFATFEALLEQTLESRPMWFCSSLSTNRKHRPKSRQFVAAWFAVSPTAARIGCVGQPNSLDWNQLSARHTVQRR